jgi:hypothetical protein
MYWRGSFLPRSTLAEEVSQVTFMRLVDGEETTSYGLPYPAGIADVEVY